METYKGIKFRCRKKAVDFEQSDQLTVLDRWVYIFAELGLAPVHGEGAYGNHSFRMGGHSFVVTRTGMTPQAKMDVQDYCLVESYDEKTGVFEIRGRNEPSSESFLHYFVYRAFPSITTIMHGHSGLLNQHAATLGIPVTTKKQPYGTVELARSALDVLSKETPFIIMKDHGFVAMGDDINTTAKMVLTEYARLIALL